MSLAIIQTQSGWGPHTFSLPAGEYTTAFVLTPI